MSLIDFKHRKFLIKYNHREDFGHEWYAQLFNIKRWSLLQLSVSWNDYPSWPYLQVKSGSGDVLSLLFWAYKFGFDATLIGRTWSWDHIDQLEEEEDVQHTD